MGLQIPHQSYCDSPPRQNLSMKRGMHMNDIMIQHAPNLIA